MLKMMAIGLAGTTLKSVPTCRAWSRMSDKKVVIVDTVALMIRND